MEILQIRYVVLGTTAQLDLQRKSNVLQVPM